MAEKDDAKTTISRLDKSELAADADCHLMVQVMESWFLADAEALGEYFKDRFKIDPQKVQERSKWANRFLCLLKEKME